MPYEQVETILKRAQTFHQKLGDIYSDLEGRTDADNERLRLLLDYLQQHEVRMEHSLDVFERNAPKKIMHTWLQFPPDEKVERIIDQSRLGADMSVNDIVVLTLDFDNLLLNFYRKAADESNTDEIKEIFDRLFEEGKKERNKLVHAAFGFEHY